MPHGQYIQELESVAWERGYVFGHHSLWELINKLDFSKLSDSSFSDRGQFYYTLIDQLQPDPSRKTVEGKTVLREPDALSIIGKMDVHARNYTLTGRIRDIWCKVFIGGCP
jgi:hypothetical protein